MLYHEYAASRMQLDNFMPIVLWNSERIPYG